MKRAYSVASHVSKAKSEFSERSAADSRGSTADAMSSVGGKSARSAKRSEKDDRLARHGSMASVASKKGGSRGGSSGREREEGKKHLAAKKRLEEELELQMHAFNGLAARMKAQDEAAAAVADETAASLLRHEARITALQDEAASLRTQTVETQDRILDKETLVEANKAEISEWQNASFGLEVRRIYNFITRIPNLDIDGVKPEEVFSSKVLAAFCQFKRSVACDKRTALLLTKAARAAASAAALSAACGVFLLHEIKKERLFKAAVMRSVGLKKKGDDPGGPPADAFHGVVQMLKKDGGGGGATGEEEESVPLPDEPTDVADFPARGLLYECRRQLHALCLGAADGALTPRSRAKRLRATGDKHFEVLRLVPSPPPPPACKLARRPQSAAVAAPDSAEARRQWSKTVPPASCSPRILLHVHLPEAYAGLPVERW